METLRIVLWIILVLVWGSIILIQTLINKTRHKQIQELEGKIDLLLDLQKDHWFFIKKLLEKDEKTKSSSDSLKEVEEIKEE